MGEAHKASDHWLLLGMAILWTEQATVWRLDFEEIINYFAQVKSWKKYFKVSFLRYINKMCPYLLLVIFITYVACSLINDYTSSVTIFFQREEEEEHKSVFNYKNWIGFPTELQE